MSRNIIEAAQDDDVDTDDGVLATAWNNCIDDLCVAIGRVKSAESNVNLNPKMINKSNFSNFIQKEKLSISSCQLNNSLISLRVKFPEYFDQFGILKRQLPKKNDESNPSRELVNTID